MSNGTFQVLKPKKEEPIVLPPRFRWFPVDIHTQRHPHPPTHTEQAQRCLEITHTRSLLIQLDHMNAQLQLNQKLMSMPRKGAQRETVFSFHTIQWVFTRLNYNFS